MNDASTNSTRWTARQREKPVTWPPQIAIPVAFGGLYMAVAGFSAGRVSVGVAALLAMGLALGFSGSLRARVIVAVTLWLVVTGLAGVSTAFGETGFSVIMPALFCLLFVALGQGVGLVSGAAFRRLERVTAPE